MRTKLTQVGNSYAVLIPKETVDRLNVNKGDELTFTNTADGFSISVYDDEFEEQMKVVDKYSNKYRNALHSLANK